MESVRPCKASCAPVAFLFGTWPGVAESARSRLRDTLEGAGVRGRGAL